MKYSSIPSSQGVVFHCKSRGIKNIVISPGSRNAPLTIGFTEDDFFNCFSIVDERCAAFFALGIAQQTDELVVLVCTSGSALLNYYPAIAEAYYSNIPLVVVSADRPKYKVDIGDGQTIRQENVFQNHIGYSANLKLDISHSTEKIKEENPSLLSDYDTIGLGQEQVQIYNDKKLNKAFNYACLNKEPVHINVPFEEPLYEILDNPSSFSEVQIYEPKPLNITEDIKKFVDSWNASSKKMVLIGTNSPNQIEQQFLDELAEDGSVVVFTETTSNIHHPKFFPCIDSILAPIEKSVRKEALFNALQPDILLTLGGLVVSKKIKAFLRNYKPKHHWHISPLKANNTFFSLNHHFKQEVNSFFHNFLALTVEGASSYQSYWLERKQLYEHHRKAYIKTIPFSDMLVFSILLKHIPENYMLQSANSSTIRYLQLFNLNTNLSVFCNRGTSGIDGSTSTAIGASIYHKTPTLLITGDLSFFYDSNALWNNYLKSDFRIIVINNSGGGIFRILPGNDDSDKYARFFETSHELNAEGICKMYNIDYNIIENESDLVDSLSSFFLKSHVPKLLEIKTPRIMNDKILLSYFDFIS